MYGVNTEAPSVCPGEAKCDKWKGTRGKSRAIRERAVCHPCEFFSTKTDLGKKSHKAIVQLVKDAHEIRFERLAGYVRHPDQMTNYQFQTLLMIEQMVEQEEILMRVQVHERMLKFFAN
jgi:hypothetical protein